MKMGGLQELKPIEPEDITSLLHVEEQCWQMLEHGVANRRSAMHQAVIATIQEGIPVMRTVVLRRAETAAKALYLHTDIRSKKMQELHDNPSLSWLLYDPSMRSQIRLAGNVIIHHQDECAAAHWQKTGHHSRRYYMTGQGPSQEVMAPETGLDERLTAFDYTLEESEKGFDHFVVVESRIHWMEWYFTHSSGNRRASFRYADGVLNASGWLTP